MAQHSVKVLNSRIRKSIATTFDVFTVFHAYPSSKLIRKYPEDFSDGKILKSVENFSVPCDMKRTTDDVDQQFYFVLTDSNSYHTFGFCVYNKKNDLCYCLLSGYFMPHFFYSVLSYISTTNDAKEEDLLLTQIYHSELPPYGTFEIGTSALKRFKFKIPNMHSYLPLERMDTLMKKFFATFDSNVLLICLFASILKERRIVITAEKLSTISACVHGCATLLLPMYWQSLLIPILPENMIETLMAPMPYIIGLPKHLLERASHLDIAPVVVYDADAKTLHSPFNDHEIFPSEISGRLRNTLKQANALKHDPEARWNNISHAFYCSNALLFGNFRLGYEEKSPKKFVWNTQLFLKHQPASFRPFLDSLLGQDGVQYLEKFVNDYTAYVGDMDGNEPFEREHKKAMSRRFQNPTTEALQDAMSLIKENASDVVGSLKSKISGAQIRQKFTRFSRDKKGDPPMSFENAHWFVESNDVPDEATSSQDNAVGDLIDFSDPIPVTTMTQRKLSAAEDLLGSLNLSGTPMVNNKNSDEVSEFGSVPTSFDNLIGSHKSPFDVFDDKVPLKTQSDLAKKQQKWETFD